MPKRTSNFQRLLRKSGYKATTPRLAVLAVLQKEKNPLSAQDLIGILKNEMDKVTVYRILKALKEKGLVRQVDLRHNHAHYEITTNTEHHHLICTGCGRIEDVRDCKIEDTHAVVLKHSKHFSEIKQHALEFYGVCKTCRKKQA